MSDGRGSAVQRGEIVTALRAQGPPRDEPSGKGGGGQLTSLWHSDKHSPSTRRTHTVQRCVH